MSYGTNLTAGESVWDIHDPYINPLKTERRPLYLNAFHLGYKNQSVYAVSGTSRCLFSDKYKT